jgi:hypothetical protein
MYYTGSFAESEKRATNQNLGVLFDWLDGKRKL